MEKHAGIKHMYRHEIDCPTQHVPEKVRSGAMHVQQPALHIYHFGFLDGMQYQQVADLDLQV